MRLGHAPDACLSLVKNSGCLGSSRQHQTVPEERMALSALLYHGDNTQIHVTVIVQVLPSRQIIHTHLTQNLKSFDDNEPHNAAS